MATTGKLAVVWFGALMGLAVPHPAEARADRGTPAPRAARTAAPRDGQHDFDFNLGVWTMHVRRLDKPLTGSTTWVEYDGLARGSKVWGGRANLLELDVEGPAGRIEGAGLRLYNAATGRWSINWASSRTGLTQPMIGGFENGRGEFFDSEVYDGKPILSRNSFLDITPTSTRFEQAFSADGGRTWETNWVMTFTRADDALAPEDDAVRAHATSRAAPRAADGDVSHDFDWEFGTWNLRVNRLSNPLTGSTTWVPMTGTVAVRKIWGGRANLAEVDAMGPAGRVRFLAWRLYNPTARQWTLSFSTLGGGALGVPMVGEFKNGRGEFYDQEPFRGRAILVRFVFSAPSGDSGRSEQAFSADGGKTWETNWVNQYTRAGAARGRG